MSSSSQNDRRVVFEAYDRFFFSLKRTELKINPLLKICILKIIIVPKDNIAERKQSSPNIFRDFNRDVICACLEGVETRESKKEEKQTHTHTKRKLFTRTIARSSVVNDTTALQDGYFYPSPKPSLSNPFSSSFFYDE